MVVRLQQDHLPKNNPTNPGLERWSISLWVLISIYHFNLVLKSVMGKNNNVEKHLVKLQEKNQAKDTI